MLKSTQSTNNFRRCSFCPHQEHKKLSCGQTGNFVQSVKVKSSSGLKNKSKKSVNLKKSNNMSFINNTLPIFSSSSAYSNFNPNIIAENSILRTQNDYLKRELESQNKVSAFMKQDREQYINLSSNQTSRTHKLHDKLYYSNVNLQETLFELDNLSKINSNLYLENIKIQQQKQQLKIINQSLLQENLKLKKKIKKAYKSIQQLPNQLQLEKIFQHNHNLQSEKSILCEEIQELKEMLRINNQNKIIVQTENLSPEWIANTSTKINIIEKSVAKLESENKENLTTNNSDSYPNELSQRYKDQIDGLRKQIISSIKCLKFQSRSFMFGSSTFEEMMNNCNSSLILLIKSLCQSLLQPLQTLFTEVFKDIDRKLKNFGHKVVTVVHKMENIIIKVENNKLRQKNKGRQF